MGASILATTFKFPILLTLSLLTRTKPYISSSTIFSGYLKQADDTYSYYGSDSDIKVGYDETTNDALVIGANVEGAALNLHLYADQGDDNADHWLWSIADGGVITWQSKTGFF